MPGDVDRWRPLPPWSEAVTSLDCKSVAKATQVRILDPPPGAKTAPDQRESRSGAVA